jgi:hypothetical protein
MADLREALTEIWDAFVRLEHRAERALGLHPPPDPGAGVSRGGDTGAAGASVAAHPGTPERAERIRGIAANLSRYWPELSGKSGAMPPQALELALAQAGLESSWGAGWTDKTASGAGDMRGSNNYGGRHCGAQGAGAAWRCVEYDDTKPNDDGTSTPFKVTMRFFVDGEGRSAAENGAYYFLKDLTHQWPVTAELESGSVKAYAHRLGPDKANGGLYYYGGFGKNFAEREANYAKAITRFLPEVAAALGHPHVMATIDNDPPLAGAADAATFDPVTWVEIDAPGGYRIKTNAEPLAMGGVPVAMSFEQLIAAAKSLGALPITAPISDARWAAAKNKTIVNPIADPRGALDVNTPAGKVQAATFAARYGALGTALRDGGHKEMVLARNLTPSGPNSMIFYGWRLPGGKTIQKGQRSDHNRQWIEYDSYASLVRRDATKNGETIDLFDELQKEGPLAAPPANGPDGRPLPPLPAFIVGELGGTAAGALAFIENLPSIDPFAGWSKS